MERYGQAVGPEAHAEPRPRDTCSTVAKVVRESGHYYQVRITPRPLENHWDLEDADSMLPRDVDLPNGPTPLLPGQPLDPLAAIASGAAGTWHPGHASTACGDGPNKGGRIPGIRQRYGGSTWMTGNRQKPCHPTNRQPGGPPRTTCAPSL